MYAITYARIAVALLDDIERQIHIGPRVRALREAMDLSLRDLAERSGVSAPMLSQVERGRGGSARHGHRFEVLTAPLPGQRAELSRHVLAAGARTGGPGDPPMHEPGSREVALVESGPVTLVIDGDRHELGGGDCVTFDADLTHHFENPGPDEAVILAVVCAGLRRS